MCIRDSWNTLKLRARIFVFDRVNNLPAADLFCKETRKVKETDYIRDRFASLGVTQNTDPAKMITYSGSGNHSALLIAAMEHAGLPVATHYVGGWSQWSARLGNKVATAL